MRNIICLFRSCVWVLQKEHIVMRGEDVYRWECERCHCKRASSREDDPYAPFRKAA